MEKIIITIDGWSSCGKSTLAKQLAKELNYVYIDSGAMYRAITLYFLRNHVDWTNDHAVDEALKDIHLEFVANHKNRPDRNVVERRKCGIRDPGPGGGGESERGGVGKSGARICGARQQEMGRGKGIVMDGRDIGTVVFPKAELKIFMTADKAVRVERRFKELYEKNPNITLEEVKNNLEMRDYIDSTGRSVR